MKKTLLTTSLAAAVLISAAIFTYTYTPGPSDAVAQSGYSGGADLAPDVAAILVDTGTTIPGTITTLQASATALQAEIPATNTWGDGNDATASAGQNSLDALLDLVILEVPSTDTWGAGASIDASAGQNVISAENGVIDGIVDSLLLRVPATATYGSGTAASVDLGQNELDALIDLVILEIPSTDTWGDGNDANASAGQNSLDALLDLVILEIPSTDTWGAGASADASAGQNVLYGGLVGTDTAVNRRAGAPQFATEQVAVAANAGNTTVFTATTQPFILTSCVIRAAGVTTADLTSAALEAATAQTVELISAATAAVANINAAGEQVSWTGAVYLAAGETVNMDLAGTGGTAVDLQVTCSGHAVVDLGYLLPLP